MRDGAPLITAMAHHAKKYLRAFQVHFPFLLDAKFSAMRWVRRTFRLPFEEEFRAIPLFNPPEGALFLDIGANRGQSTDAILMQHPTARVTLFEPNELLFRKLQAQFAGRESIVLHNCGLGDDDAAHALYIPFYRKWMFDGLASFDRDEAADWLRGRLAGYDERHFSLVESRALTRRLDEFDLRPFFMKLDVQGFEYRALKGGEQTLQQHQPVLLLEAPDVGTTQFLGSLGYEPYGYAEGRFTPGPSSGRNTFFLPPDKAALVSRHIAQPAAALAA